MHPNANCNCRYADVGCDKMEEVMDQISGKWKMRILFMVGAHGTLRLSLIHIYRSATCSSSVRASPSPWTAPLLRVSPA